MPQFARDAVHDLSSSDEAIDTGCDDQKDAEVVMGDVGQCGLIVGGTGTLLILLI